ncbi:hypothetical protein IHQ68_12735 [Chelatococcus sambhunathii]|uniref:Uncharacterized protein n=1 Tax=Chelatococcus sambhunathii TaxID=363953 RepID=A0ABU1DH90_9HYPH|nr:hypothetical protein [Chelatococcus sambhunathii]MDR4307484.1 hypothetical protein [Chelatococcus sambhunathii]
MGLVLAFETAPRPAARQPQKRAAPAQSADILFFTGVRYQRDAQKTPDRPTPAAERTEPTPVS